MQKDKLPTKRDLFKALGIEHLKVEEIISFNFRELDKETMAWAVWHLSECAECCEKTADLTEAEITEAITGSNYQNLLEEIIEYYFETIGKIDLINIASR